MHQSLLEILRCPFCGSAFDVVENQALVRTADRIETGVLGCECCAFPIVAGIPVLIADDTAREAMHAMEAGRHDAALHTMLGLDAERAGAFRALLSRADATYAEAIEILSPDAEGTYFIYRFSDPTYVMAETVLEAVGSNALTVAGRVLDLCGGSGHLSRVVQKLQPAGGSFLADLFFWKLWLAARFTAPGTHLVCCDGNNPLPFNRHTFSMVVLSDAFPYIWHKRMLADDMMRLVQPGGLLVMPHLHSSLGENFSAGMTLTPASYRNLFAPMSPRLFSDRMLLDDALERGAVDLSADVTAARLGAEPSLTLIAGGTPDVYRHYSPAAKRLTGTLAVNPLYRADRNGTELQLELHFPTPEYEEEFSECKRYLPAKVTLPGDLSVEALGERLESLLRHRIVLDAPPRYASVQRGRPD